MFKNYVCTALIAATLSCAPSVSVAQSRPSTAQRLASLQYLIGTWTCTWSVNGKTGQLEQIFTPALGGSWIEEQERIRDHGNDVTTSIHYTGYDAKNNMYVHIGPDADGGYELAKSSDGNTWQSTDGTFVHTKLSNTERKMTQAQGSMLCTKAP